MALNSEIWWAAANAGPFPPDKPRSFTATASGQAARLRAETEANGSPITKWQYRVGTTADNVDGAWTDISSSDSETLDFSLQIGIAQTRYFQVRAVNAEGTGDASDVAGVTTATIAPLKPTGFSVTTTSARRFRLRASVNNGGVAVTKWQYKIATSAGGLSSASWTDIDSSAADALDFTLSTVFSGGTTRHFQVRAVNTIGDGQSSDAKSATIADVITTDTDSIYQRAATAPSAPSGGTNSATHTPTGWSRTVLTATATQNVYRSQRERTYTNGSFTSAAAWGTPELFASRSGTAPLKPTSYSVTATAARRFRLRASVNNGGLAITKWQRRGATTEAGIASASWTDIGSSADSALDWTTDAVYGGGTTRYFQVRAVNTIGNGVVSDIMSATIANVLTTDTDFIYRRAATTPGAPSGGTNSETHEPTGWSRTVLTATATLNVYRSQRTRTYTNGSFTSATAWGTPALFAARTSSEPLKPTGFTVTATTARRFRLRASVDNGGSAITKWQYKIATTANGLASASWTDIGSSAADALDFTLSTVFSGGTTRHFQVRAVNTIGNGQASDAGSATAASEPGRPTSFQVTASGQAFRLRADVAPNGSAITKWQYRISTTSGGVGSASWTDIPNSASSSLDWTTANIAFGVTRYFQVRAVNGVGNSPASATGSATTSASEPDQPTNFRVTPVGQGFRLRADVEINGSAITQWQYKIATTSGGLESASWTDIGSSASDALDFTTGNIGRGTTRHFQVRAVNGIGNGPESSIASATTEAAAAPSQPTGFSVTATNRAFRLRASVEANGSAITKWQYKIATGANGLASASWQDISGSASSSLDWTTGNIGYSTTRHFQVRAVNAVDNGPASASASATTGAQQEPGAVRNLAAAASVARTLAVAFDASNTGSPADRYEYRLTALGNEQTITLPHARYIFAGASNTQAAAWVWTGRTDRVKIDDALAAADSWLEYITLLGETFTRDAGLALKGNNLATNSAAVRMSTAFESRGQVVVTLDLGTGSFFTATLSMSDATFSGEDRNGYSFDGVDGTTSGLDALVGRTSRIDGRNGGTMVLRDYVPIENPQWQSIGANRSVTLSSLIPGATYRIEVRGVNAAGNGAVASIEATVST